MKSDANHCHLLLGDLFQARFRSLETRRYIVLNERRVRLRAAYPVRAGLCAHPEQWPWSSYRALAGQVPPPSFLCTDVLLGHFGTSRAAAQAAYRRFVEEGIAEALEEQVRGERLGQDPFLRERFGLDLPLAEIPRGQVEPLRRPLAVIFAESTEPVAAVYRDHGYTLSEIGEYLGCHYSTVSRRLRREEEALLQ